MDIYELPSISAKQIFYPQKSFAGYLLSIDETTIQMIFEPKHRLLLQVYFMQPLMVVVEYKNKQRQIFADLYLTDLINYSKDRAILGKLELPGNSGESSKLKQSIKLFKEFMDQKASNL